MATQITAEQVHDSDQGELKRAIGPRLLLFFIVGDIIGAGVFAITGDVAGEVGGVAWVPFLVAFAVAANAITANASEKKYRRFRRGLPSRVTRKNIRPSSSKQCFRRNRTPDSAPSSHSCLGSTVL